MARSVLDVIIRTKKRGQGPKELSGDLTKLLSTMAAVVAAGAAIKQAFDLAKEGAQILATEQRFDRLAQSIGTTSDALKRDLRTATRGLIDDVTLLDSSTRLMALGLARSHDEAVRLANISGQLGMDMNQLTLTLTNMSTMRFDALGVSIEGFKDKVKALEDAGLSAEDAFRKAFIEQAEAQLDKVGSIADTAAGAFERLSAATATMSGEGKKLLVEVFGPMADQVADVLWESINFNDAIERMGLNTRTVNAALKQTGRFLGMTREELVEWAVTIQQEVGDADRAMLQLAGTIDGIPEEKELDVEIDTSDAEQDMETFGSILEEWARDLQRRLHFRATIRAQEEAATPGTTQGGGGGPGTSGLFEQHGGPVQAGRPYVVGERGRPEIFVPDQPGTVINHNQSISFMNNISNAVDGQALVGQLETVLRRRS